MRGWPDIPYQQWEKTGRSLHMWAQVVGKFRLAQTPWINHSCQATFYVTARGLTTSVIPGHNCSFEAVFDFIDHELKVFSTDGGQAIIDLRDMSVAHFHEEFCAALTTLNAPTDFHDAPNEVLSPVPFQQQTDEGEYDREAVQKFWRALLSIDQVFKKFRTGFLGKTSPVHLFWGSFDLAVTRFSGRKAPMHPGGVPALPDEITREAYSHEVSSAGFWPGGGGVNEPAFYSYAYPTPEGFSEQPAGHEKAYFSSELGEFILPYDAIRKDSDPSAALLHFLNSTYEAAANCGEWDRESLECEIGEARRPRRLDFNPSARST